MSLRRLVVLSLFFAFVSAPLSAATRNWTGTTSGQWSVASNWGGTAPLAGDDLVFGVTNNANALSNDYAAGTAFNSLTFNAATTFSVSGNTISLGAGGLTQSGSAVVNDFVPFTLTAPQSWTSASPGSFGLNGPAALGLGANTLTVGGSGSDFIASTVSGTGGITISGTVALTLSGNLTYTGPTTVQSGAKLILTSIGTINTPIVVNSGGTLATNPGFTPLTSSTVTLNSGSTYSVTINGTATNQFSRLTSNAGVNINGGSLQVTSSTVVPAGTVFTILTGQGGTFLTGTFAGLPEGATVSSGVQSYTVHYGSQDVSLTALAAGVVAPSIAKAFGVATMPVGGTTTLAFTITNPNAGTALIGVAFSDTLPAGLTVATPNGLTGGCGSGTITTSSGSVGLSGGTIAAAGQCSFSVNIVAGTAGVKNNTTSAVTTSNAGTGNQATASVAVLAPPSLAKAFGAPSIAAGASTTLTFTLTNTNATQPLSGVAFSDPLPAGMTVANPSGASTTCSGATLTAAAGSSTISLSGATVPASGSCTATVSVTSSTLGAANNTTAAITSSNAGSGNTANASLTVTAAVAPVPALSPLMMLLVTMAMAAAALMALKR